MSEHFQTVEDAASYMELHDSHAVRLNQARLATLQGMAVTERQRRKIVLLEGGQGSREELISEILALRYPLIAEARRVVSDVKLQAMAEAALNARGMQS